MLNKKEERLKNNNNDLFHKKKFLNRMEYKKGPFSRSETLLVDDVDNHLSQNLQPDSH